MKGTDLFSVAFHIIWDINQYSVGNDQQVDQKSQWDNLIISLLHSMMGTPYIVLEGLTPSWKLPASNPNPLDASLSKIYNPLLLIKYTFEKNKYVSFNQWSVKCK